MRTVGRRMVLVAALAAAASGTAIARHGEIGFSSLHASTGTAGAEDDLAVVKRAVARQGDIGSSSRHESAGARQEAPATTPAQAVGADEPTRVDGKDDARERRTDARPRLRGSGRDLRWFKVRITEKGSKKSRVNVNLPIALVLALGDDFPIDIGRHGGWRGGSEKTIRLGEVLATLEAGQSLVEIDDDDATVRVWVE